MMRYGYDMYKYLLIVNKNLTKEYFLQQAGVTKGYAKDFFIRIYDSFFAESENVEELFQNYYRQEYTNLNAFLRGYYGIKEEWIKEISDTLRSNPDYTLIDYHSLDYGDNGIEDMVFSDNLRKRFANLFLMKN